MNDRSRPLIDVSIEALTARLQPVFPGRRVVRAEAITRGRASTNFKVLLDNTPRALLLRLSQARLIAKEAALASRLSHAVPVPRCLFQSLEPVAFAVFEWMDGEPLDEVLVDDAVRDAWALGEAVGSVLVAIGCETFDRPGDLGPDLAVEPWPFDPSFAGFFRHALIDGPASRRLGEETTRELWEMVEREAATVDRRPPAAALVHGDFNPTNILVKRTAGGWAVAAVLDWEWAHSGDPLMDCGNLLRDDESLDDRFVRGFSTVFERESPFAAAGWRQRARLIDLTSQVEFLSSIEERPSTHAAAIRRIRAMLDGWRAATGQG